MKKKTRKKPDDPARVIASLPKESQQLISLFISTKSNAAVQAFLHGGAEAVVQLHSFTPEQTRLWADLAVKLAIKYMNIEPDPIEALGGERVVSNG